LQTAKELGATHVIDGSNLGDKTLVEAIREVADGIGPNIAVVRIPVALTLGSGDPPP